MVKDRIETDSGYATTTDLARLCGVSRFTVINWVKQGKVKAISTPGGHHRIPLSEAVSFLETLHANAHRQRTSADLPARCWEADGKKGYDDECGNCAIYKRRGGYCFILARQLCREALHCDGNCRSCDHFDELLGRGGGLPGPGDKVAGGVGVGEGMGPGGTGFLYSVSYNISYNIGRGVHRLKRGISGLRMKISGG